MSNRFTLILIATTLMFLSGCASNGGDHRDPIEGLNRAIYNFNEGLDKIIIKPVAKGYQAVVPDPVDKGVTNFFGNINDVVTTVNGLLQFKFRQGGSDALRVLINSTLGVLGLFDVATKMGFEKHDEDFGQTLGYWGLGHGPYLVLPVLGPSSVRDATGRLVDASAFDPLYQVDHIPTRNSLRALQAIDRRSDLLGATSVFEQAALDKYNFLKESYFQQRENAVNDGELTFPE
jgi:phospholipid-binding lipoprotein MlaA